MMNNILAILVCAGSLAVAISAIFCNRLAKKVDKEISKTMRSVTEGFDLARAYVRQESRRLELMDKKYTGKRWNGENHDS